MKNMKKFITLCGFLILGSIACGDADVVKAEATNSQTTDTSGYTITIPSDVDINKDSGKGSFAVTGKIDAQTKLDVTVNSQNGYKLKCGSKSIDYTLAKQSFRVDNIKSSDVKSFNENFDATLSYTGINFSGSYSDKLTFNIESNVYIYKLNLNSILDGVTNYSVHDYGTADIYINEKKVADDVSDWGGTVHYGDTYEIKDIKGTTGHHYSGASDGENNLNNFPLKGKIGIDTKHVENSEGILYSSIFLKFDTNTYTVKYDSNGGKGSMADTVHKYYKSDKMDGVTKLRKNAFAKAGYKFNGWYMTKTINGETYYLYDNWQWYKEGSQPSVTKKYLYVNERASSNATTVDKDVLTAVAQWSPITYTIKYDGNGADSGVMENTTHIYHASTAESGVVQLRKNTFKKSGYSFSGWVFSKKINGEIYYIYNNWQWYKDNEQPSGVEKYFYKDEERSCNATTTDGDTIIAIAQWKKQYILSFDTNGGTISEGSRTVLEGNVVGKLPIPTKDGYEFYGWYNNISSEEKYYLFNSDNKITKDTTLIACWGPDKNNLATKNKDVLKDGIYKIFQAQEKLSNYCFTPQFENTDLTNPLLLKKDNSSEYALWQVEHDNLGYVMFKNIKTGNYLDLDSACAQSNQVVQLYKKNDTYAQKWIVIKVIDGYKIFSACNPNFVIDLNGGGLWDDGSGRLKLWWNNGTAAQLWNFKQIYDTGTVLNIEGSEYVVMKNVEDNKYLVVSKNSVANKPYQINYSESAKLRSDGQNASTYDGSDIDKYLENEWYNSLSSTMKAAVQPYQIRQNSFAFNPLPTMVVSVVCENGPNNQVYSQITRHIFLPGVDDLLPIVKIGYNPQYNQKPNDFLKNDTIWIRNSYQGDASMAAIISFRASPMNCDSLKTEHAIRPAFVIDLSKIDYTVTGSVNYK